MITTAMARGTIVPTTTGVVILEPPDDFSPVAELDEAEEELELSLTTNEGMCSCRRPFRPVSGTRTG